MGNRLLICGNRTWDDYISVISALQGFCVIHGRPDVVIHGDARGADTFADCAAKYLGIPIEKYTITPAMWDELGPAAGPTRNTVMLAQGDPTHCIAFAGNFELWSGTLDMVIQCDDAEVPVACLQSRGQTEYWVACGCPFDSYSQWLLALHGGKSVGKV